LKFSLPKSAFQAERAAQGSVLGRFRKNEEGYVSLVWPRLEDESKGIRLIFFEREVLRDSDETKLGEEDVFGEHAIVSGAHLEAEVGAIVLI
jgi:hypothetical protein